MLLNLGELKQELGLTIEFESVFLQQVGNEADALGRSGKLLQNRADETDIALHPVTTGGFKEGLFAGEVVVELAGGNAQVLCQLARGQSLKAKAQEERL